MRSGDALGGRSRCARSNKRSGPFVARIGGRIPTNDPNLGDTVRLCSDMLSDRDNSLGAVGASFPFRARGELRVQLAGDQDFKSYDVCVRVHTETIS